MFNYIQDGDTIPFLAPYTVVSGAGALLGKIFGVACDDITSGVSGQFKTSGVFDLTKTTGAVAVGDPVYWDNTNKYCTTTANSNAEIGVCISAALSGDATVRVKLSEGLIIRRFISAEQTGTGSAQNVAHGLGVTPSKVFITYTDLTPATAGSVNVTYGTHTSTNVVVTVTSGKKFLVVAEY
jgi:predicted RecA/RadA family phage recombinase